MDTASVADPHKFKCGSGLEYLLANLKEIEIVSDYL
jgi:hypothetical protein